MLKNIFISILTSQLLLSIFYGVDRATNNGKGLILFSFLSISCAYLFSFFGLIALLRYIFKRKYSDFLFTLIPIFLFLNIVTTYFASFEISGSTLKLFLTLTPVILSIFSSISLIIAMSHYYLVKSEIS